MDELKFQFDIYRCRFKQPLRTNHGIWQIREGIIISLMNRAGIIGKGEIAPLPWFGSETMSQAIEFCQQFGETIAQKDIIAIPDTLPCCQFALESAWLDLNCARSDKDVNAAKDLDYCYLLPAGKDYCYLLPAGNQALTTWQDIYRATKAFTFKWKIGVHPLARELEILDRLVNTFPPGIKLRLDANGGLNLQQTRDLLSITDTLGAIEFVEQPLPPDSFAELLQLSQEYTTPLALDESIASFTQLQQAYRQGWQGVYIIKAAIMGSPLRLIKFCLDNNLDVVFSSVFETEVGRNAVLKMSRQLNHPRAVGFGVQYFC